MNFIANFPLYDNCMAVKRCPQTKRDHHDGYIQLLNQYISNASISASHFQTVKKKVNKVAVGNYTKVQHALIM